MGKEGTPIPKSSLTQWDIEQAREHAMNNLSSEPDERATEIAIINEEVDKTKPKKVPAPPKKSRQEEINNQIEEWTPW